MEPQACLQQIIDQVNAVKELPHTLDAQREPWKKIANLLRALAVWLRDGGVSPRITGPIFGTSPVMLTKAFTVGLHVTLTCKQHSDLPIGQIEAGYGRYLYVLCVVDQYDIDCREWMLVEFLDHNEINRWVFDTPAQPVKEPDGPASLPATDH